MSSVKVLSPELGSRMAPADSFEGLDPFAPSPSSSQATTDPFAWSSQQHQQQSQRVGSPTQYGLAEMQQMSALQAHMQGAAGINALSQASGNQQPNPVLMEQLAQMLGGQQASAASQNEMLQLAAQLYQQQQAAAAAAQMQQQAVAAAQNQMAALQYLSQLATINAVAASCGLPGNMSHSPAQSAQLAAAARMLQPQQHAAAIQASAAAAAAAAAAVSNSMACQQRPVTSTPLSRFPSMPNPPINMDMGKGSSHMTLQGLPPMLTSQRSLGGRAEEMLAHQLAGLRTMDNSLGHNHGMPSAMQAPVPATPLRSQMSMPLHFSPRSSTSNTDILGTHYSYFSGSHSPLSTSDGSDVDSHRSDEDNHITSPFHM